MKVFKRIWVGIVGAMTGAALAALIQIIGQMTMGFSINYLQWILLICAGSGFLLGILTGPQTKKPKAQI